MAIAAQFRIGAQDLADQRVNLAEACSRR